MRVVADEPNGVIPSRHEKAPIDCTARGVVPRVAPQTTSIKKQEPWS